MENASILYIITDDFDDSKQYVVLFFMLPSCQ